MITQTVSRNRVIITSLSFQTRRSIFSFNMNFFFLIYLFLVSQASLAQEFEKDIVLAAIERTTKNVTYDGSYFSIPYPNGDVPPTKGVCTDVIIRSYRKIGIDLQLLVHEDMSRSFEAYPSKRIWGLTTTDKNIDHRRVPNLQVFFSRNGEVLSTAKQANQYLAGDIVTWMLPGNLPHIGIVTDKHSTTTGNPLIVHNIGAGPNLEDMLFSYKITGHFRYVPKTYLE